MSLPRNVTLRACRLQLSQRYRCLHQKAPLNASAETTAPTATHIPTSPTGSPIVAQQALRSAASPKSQYSSLRRNRILLICSAFAVGVGIFAGQSLNAFFNPLPPPIPGSVEDEKHMKELYARIDKEFKVSVLRGKCLGVAKQLKGEEAGWVEVVSLARTSTEAETVPATQVGGVEGGALIQQIQGSGHLGVERIFYNRAEQQLVAVVWFGSALSGWPGVTHGGLLATALTDKISLAASLAQPSHSISAAAIPQRLPGQGDHAKISAPTLTAGPTPAELTLSYVKPTRANHFYVIRASPAHFDAAGETKYMREPFTSGQGYEATIETMDGKVCVKAQAKVTKSSSVGGAIVETERKVVEGAERRYAEFKQWLWPSRQEQTSRER